MWDKRQHCGKPGQRNWVAMTAVKKFTKNMYVFWKSLNSNSRKFNFRPFETYSGNPILPNPSTNWGGSVPKVGKTEGPREPSVRKFSGDTKNSWQNRFVPRRKRTNVSEPHNSACYHCIIGTDGSLQHSRMCCLFNMIFPFAHMRDTEGEENKGEKWRGRKRRGRRSERREGAKQDANTS